MRYKLINEDKQYGSLEEYIVEFYNNKYNTNATKLVELSENLWYDKR